MIFKRRFNFVLLLNEQFLFRNVFYLPNASVMSYKVDYFALPSGGFILPVSQNSLLTVEIFKDKYYIDFLELVIKNFLQNESYIEKYKTFFSSVKDKFIYLKKLMEKTKVSSYFVFPKRKRIIYKEFSFFNDTENEYSRLLVEPKEEVSIEINSHVKWSYTSAQLTEKGFFTQEAEIVTVFLEDAVDNEELLKDLNKVSLVSNEKWLTLKEIHESCKRVEVNYHTELIERFVFDFDKIIEPFSNEEKDDIFDNIILKAL